MELSGTSLRTLGIPLPDLDSQNKIVAFLDDRLQQIEGLLAEQQRLQTLVVARRAAELDLMIEHGGLESELKGVDSPWIDSVPTSWSFMRLKHCVARVTVGIVINPSHYYEDEGVPVLRGLNVRPGRVSSDDLVYMSEESNQLHSKSVLEKGDVVVVRTGAAGAAAVVPDWAVGGNIVDLLQIRPGPEMRPQFVELLINSRLVQQQVVSGSVGALQAHFNTSSLSNVWVVVPPLPEQDRLLMHLSEHLTRYDQLINEADTQMTLLDERRRAIICAVTTGQLDVNSLAA